MRKLTTEEFIKKSKQIHGDKYDYSKVLELKNSQTKIKIICPEHEYFMQTANAHLNQKQGCPFCRESKGERDIANFLNKNKILFNRQKTFNNCINQKTGRKLKFDFYMI